MPFWSDPVWAAPQFKHSGTAEAAVPPRRRWEQQYSVAAIASIRYEVGATGTAIVGEVNGVVARALPCACDGFMASCPALRTSKAQVLTGLAVVLILPRYRNLCTYAGERMAQAWWGRRVLRDSVLRMLSSQAAPTGSVMTVTTVANVAPTPPGARTGTR